MEKTYHSKEIAFRDDDSLWYAVSISFGLMGVGDTRAEAIKRLREATVGYLIVCYQDNLSDEKIYRGAEQEYIAMYEQGIQSQAPIPTEQEIKRGILLRTGAYKGDGSGFKYSL